MTTQTLPSQAQPFWKQAPVLNSALLVYIVVSAVALVLLDPTQLWFPTINAFVYSAFILSPFLIIGAPMSNRWRGILLAFFLFVVIPVVGVTNTSYLENAIQICIFAGLALGLNVVVGFSGLLDLGYVAFFAVGAYLWAMFTSPAETVFTVNGWIVSEQAIWIFFFLGLAAAAGVGALLGLPVLRVKGDYLAIVTLGFGEIVRILVTNLDDPTNLTNGSQGLHGVGRIPLIPGLPDLTQFIAQVENITLDNPEFVARQLMFYIVSIIILGLVIVAVRNLEDSPLGRAWNAIREDDVAAVAMGVPIVKMKLLAFALGASFGGALGVLYASKQTFVNPESFKLIFSISILSMVIVGGLGSIRGVLFGAAIVTLLDIHVLTNLSLQINSLRNQGLVDWPAALEPAKYQQLVFGFLLVMMMLFRPAGLLPASRRQVEMQAEHEHNREDVVEGKAHSDVVA